MIKKLFTHPINQETLSGLIWNGESSLAPELVYLHGGGPTSYKERVYDIANSVLKNNKTILSFDFSGHGESTGTLREGSLEKRALEAQEMIRTFAASSPLTLCGASMGGYVAIKMLELFNVDTLILMCPALYDQKAYAVPFDKGFTEIIRAHESWRNTDALSILEFFKGNLLIIMGEKDELIPSGVIDLIVKHTPNVRKKELYTIPNCPHKINVWLEDHPEERIKMQRKIAEYT